MTFSARDLVVPAAILASVTTDSLTVDLDDGRSISVPISWFPRLLHATASERANWRLIGRGEGIRWDNLDEDISIESLVAGRPSQERQESIARWLENRAKA